MFKRWFRKKERIPETAQPMNDDPQLNDEHRQTITLKGRTIERSVYPTIGASILQHADKHKVDWSSNCRRGTCARCRCRVIEGAEYLSQPNKAELARLEPEEIEAGFRLGCQAIVEKEGKIVVRHAPYF